jgi:tRNA nucleotidyltransferase/poly(A) polymerase
VNSVNHPKRIFIQEFFWELNRLTNNKQEVIDYVGGLKDIEASEIHMIGDARARFKEDPVRMIRAIRFSQKLNSNCSYT